MPAPLVVPKASLITHFGSMEATLGTHVSSARIFADWNVVPLVVGLVDTECEYTARNRGPDVPVAPVLLLGGGLWAWVGYREEWGGEPLAGRTQRFSFRSAGLTHPFRLPE